MINSEVIREYDIRGIYGETLTEKDGYLIGRSFGTYEGLKPGSTVNVCRDGRLSSPSLLSSLVMGLQDSGINVTNIGIGPSPMLYYSTFISNFGEADAGIMVTGSHNPSNYNGFKFILNKKPFFGEHIKKLHKISANYTAPNIIPQANNLNAGSDFFYHYVDMLSNVCKKPCDLKIAWDPGNGAAGDVISELCKKIPGKHIVINAKIDGTFPSHHPDPTVVANLEEIMEVVKKENCDIGIAFDGDGDRIGVIDDKCRVIWGDQLLTILAEEILQRHPGAPIIADVKASMVFFEQIKKYGGQPIMWKTGHSNIKQHMKDIGAPLAGEMSGHIFIGDQYYGYDDAAYTAVRLISLLNNKKCKLSEIIDKLPLTYSTPEIRIECSEKQKFSIVEELKKHFHNSHIKFNNIDGIRYDFKNGWGLLRASNTQAVLVCRFEALRQEDVETQIEFMRKLLKAHNVDLKYP